MAALAAALTAGAFSHAGDSTCRGCRSTRPHGGACGDRCRRRSGAGGAGRTRSVWPRRRCLPALYLGLPIGAMIVIRETDGREALFLLMLTIVVSDTAQTIPGRVFGRRPLAPAISPKKTIEGAVGGFVFGAALSRRSQARGGCRRRDPGSARALGVLIVAAGIAGDLFESMLKRSAGVKDSSTLIPGHGGILDRIDALLFAAPVYYIVLQILCETHRHSRIDRIDRPERAGRGRCASRSSPGRRPGRRRQRRASGRADRPLSSAHRRHGVGRRRPIGCDSAAPVPG